MYMDECQPKNFKEHQLQFDHIITISGMIVSTKKKFFLSLNHAPLNGT